SFLSHSELTAHFGLNNASLVHVLNVRWPGGEESEIGDVEPNRTVTLVPPSTCPGAPSEVNGLRLGKVGAGMFFTWNNTADADDYVVLADGSASGKFPLQAGVSADGTSGLT